MRTFLKKNKLKNNMICMTNEWLNEIKNYNYYNYKCDIIKNEEIKSVVDFINKNDHKLKIKDISFIKNYIYLKITKDNGNICAIVVLKKQSLFLKDNNDFILYNSVSIDYICKERGINSFYVVGKGTLNNDNVIYDQEENLLNDNLEIIDIINISINAFLRKGTLLSNDSFVKSTLPSNDSVLCFMYNENIKREIYDDNKGLLFCKKHFYYRPIFIDKLTKSQIFNHLNEKDLNVSIKIYNTFSYHVSFLKSVKIEFIDSDKYNGYDEFDLYDLSEELSEKLLEYNKKNKDVFDYIDRDEMYSILKSPFFYKFIIRNNDDEIINFVCMNWSYVTNNKGENKVYSKNGKYYCSFYNDSSSIYISYVLEVISEYCYKNNTLDIITLEDFFTGDETNYFKLIKKCARYYYIKNIKTSFVINSRKNGLIGLFN